MKERTLSSGDASNGQPTTLASPDSVMLKDCPNLVRHCTVTRYDSGAIREPGWLLIKTLGTVWVVSVKDPDSCLSVSAVGVTVDEALVTAELLVGADDGPWEVDRFLQKRPGKKKQN